MAQSWGCPGSFMAVTPWAMEHPCVGDIVQPDRPGLGPHPAPPPCPTVLPSYRPTWVAPSIWLQLSQPPAPHLLSCGGGWVEALLGSRNISGVSSPELIATQKGREGLPSPRVR